MALSGPSRAVRSWPLLVLAAPAAVAVWSGWVGIGRMTGFGQVHPLPGIWDSLHIDSAVTLPIGVEAYAAYALRAWLSASPLVSAAARRFARWSAIGALVLGMCGQVAYHLLAQAGAVRAPWGITTAVSCLPVLVLGMGAALAHLLRAGPCAGRPESPAQVPASVPAGRPDLSPVPGPRAAVPAGPGRPGSPSGPGSPAGAWSGPVAAARPDRSGCQAWSLLGDSSAVDRGGGPARAACVDGTAPVAGPGRTARLAEARAAAGPLAAAGERVSRRALRAAGLRGSNADLGALARVLTAELAAADGST